MADEKFNGPLKMDDNWGGVYRDGLLVGPATGQAVQDFIKGTFNSKVGYWKCLTMSTINNRLFGFTDETSYDEWWKVYSQNEGYKTDEACQDSRVLCWTNVEKGIPEPYYDFKVVSRLNTTGNKYVSIDGEVKLPITLVCNKVEYDSNGNMNVTAQPINATLTIEAAIGSATSKVKNIQVSLSTNPIENEIELYNELKDLLEEQGTYTVKMKLTANIDGNITASGYTSFVVVKTKIDVDLQTDWFEAQRINNDQLVLNFSCVGSNVEKYLNYRITGAGDTSGVYPLEGQNIYVGGNTRKTIYLNKNTNGTIYNIAAHGIHNIEYWMVLDKDEKFSTPHKTAQIMVIGDDYDYTPYLILKDISGTDSEKPLFNYTNRQLFKYALYAPNGYGGTLTNVDLTFTFKSVRGETVTELFDIPVVASTGVDGGYVLTHNIQIPTLDELTPITVSCKMGDKEVKCQCPPIYIDNNADYAPTPGAIFVFNPKLRSNEESSTTIQQIYNTATGKNVVVGNASSTKWSDNISFKDIDGWIEDPNDGRSLRLLSGQSLEIPFQPFKLLNNSNSNVTYEMSFKVSNVVDENVPLVSICDITTEKNIMTGQDETIYNGFELRAHDGYLLNKQQKTIANLNDNDIMFAEDERIHLTIRIGKEHSKGESITADVPYAPNKDPHSVILNENKLFARIYINGVLNRVIPISSSIDYDGVVFGTDYNASSVTTNTIERFIKLGSTQEGADLDIYEIRVYQDNEIKPEHSILKDYVATLSTTDEKDVVIGRNDILEKPAGESSVNVFREDPISYSRCQEKGINTMLWSPGTASNDFTRPNGREFGDAEKTSNAYRVGNLTLEYYDISQTGERTLNKDKSGVFHNMSTEGQGTTAMMYFKWNQRYRFDEIDGHSVGFLSQSSKETADEEAIKNSTDPVYEYKTEYKLNDNDPFIGRLDAKINWASSMQSHKMGSVNLYTDLQKRVVGGHAMNFLNSKEAFDSLDLGKMNSKWSTSDEAWADAQSFTGKEDGYGSCRVSVRQEPFMYFVKPTPSSTPVFYGMLTFGASKGDKPTFGYNKKLNPYFIMFEGTDNNRKLIEGKTPWDNAHYKQAFDKDGEVDGGIKDTTGQNLEQFEVSMGDGSLKMIGEYWNGENPCLQMFKDMMNFIFLHNPYIKRYDGTYTQLAADENADKSYMYFVTSEGGTSKYGRYDEQTQQHTLKYDVFRYSTATYQSNDKVFEEGWVPAGLTNPNWSDEGNQYYEHLNLLKQLGLSSTAVANYTNAEFQKARATRFKEGYKNLTNHAYGWNTEYPNGISDFIIVEDLQFTTSFIKLIAGTDNWSKNTYIYNPGLYFKADNNYADGKGSAKYDGLSKFGFFQDDLDTIFEIDNYGAKTKPYYVEEHDIGITTDGEKHYWNSHDNAMYSLMEIAYPNEMRSTMRSILSEMQTIAGSPAKCFETYYQDKAQNYFPEVVYNTTAEKLYMDGHYRGMSTLDGGDGDENNALAPARYSLFLEQCLGGQASAEKEWQKKRTIYLSSYAQFGAFGSGTSGNGMSFQPSNNMQLTLTPYMWLYPWMSTGSTDKSYNGKFEEAFNVPGRVPAGQPITFQISAAGEDAMVLKGVNYYKDLGNLARVSPLGGNFIIQGQRLSKLSIVGETGKPILFDAHTSFTSSPNAANNMKVIEIRGNVESGKRIFNLNSANLSDLWRLETLDLSVTNIKEVVLKSGSNIQTLKLPNVATSLTLISQTQLKNLQVNGENLNAIEIENPNEYVWSQIKQIIQQRVLTSANNRKYFNGLKLRGFVWDNMDLDTLNYIMSCSNVDLEGTIHLSTDVNVDYTLKNSLINRFGNIDDDQNKLYMTYTIKHVYDTNQIKIIGDDHIYQPGIYKFKLSYKYVDGTDANDFQSMLWRLENVNEQQFVMLNELTGLIQCTEFTDNLLNQQISIICDIQYKDANGEFQTYSPELVITLNQPLAQVGDYVYADGTYGPPSKDTGLKTIVGTCFLAYWDEELGQQKRLAVARDLGTLLQTETTDGITTTKKVGMPWGLNQTYYLSDSTSISSDIGSTTWIGDVKTKNLYNKTWRNEGMWSADYGNNNNSHVYKIRAVYSKIIRRDLYYHFNLDKYTSQTAQLGDVGWREWTDSGYRPVAKCQGARNTETIIHFRNALLNQNNFDAEQNLDTIDKLQSMINLLPDDNSRLIYYPAASYCYAYEPTQLKDKYEFSEGEIAETLNDKFKRKNWFLPSINELLRVIAYISARTNQVENDGQKKYLEAFQYYYDTYEKNGGQLNSKMFYSSTECSAGVSLPAQMPTVNSTASGQNIDQDLQWGDHYGTKTGKYYVWPCVEF